jgi:transposase
MLMEEEEGRGLSAQMRMLIADIRAQWLDLDRRIAAFEAEFTSFAKENEDARRLTTIPGVGVMIASALIAAIGKAETFEHGRDLAAWLGLVPRQSTTGGKPRLMGISKRGNTYLRKLLIHGAWQRCPMSQSGTRFWDDGPRRYLPASIRMSPPWRSPTSWRASAGPCCGANAILPPKGTPLAA